MRRALAITLTGLVAAVAAPFALAGPSGPASRHPTAGPSRSVSRHATTAAAKPFTGHVSYVETNHGAQHGQATSGIVGHGVFGGTLGSHATLRGRAAQPRHRRPVAKVAQGGSYVVRRQVSGTGVGTGFAVAKFRSHGLGSLCLSFTFTPGKYMPGTSFVPVHGVITAVGGTGQAARWHGSLRFKQTSVTGSTTESIGAGGTLQASSGPSQRLNAACAAVAALA